MYLDLAISVARRSSCLRAKVGAILVKGNRIIGTGYNGSPKGYKHCQQNGKCWTRSGYRCRATIHAEMNAILNAAVAGIGAGEGDLRLYTTLRPCLDCMKMAVAIGVKTITYLQHREDPDSDAYLVYLDEQWDYNTSGPKEVMNVERAFSSIEVAKKFKLYGLSSK